MGIPIGCPMGIPIGCPIGIPIGIPIGWPMPMGGPGIPIGGPPIMLGMAGKSYTSLAQDATDIQAFDP